MLEKLLGEDAGAMLTPELERIIQFLNKQLVPARFLGLSIKLSRAEGLRVLGPRIGELSGGNKENQLLRSFCDVFKDKRSKRIT